MDQNYDYITVATKNGLRTKKKTNMFHYTASIDPI